MDYLRLGNRWLAKNPIALYEGGVTIPLTDLERSLLGALVRADGATVSHEVLLREVWGKTYYGDESEAQPLKTAVSQLRKKTEQNPKHPVHLRTLWQEGYRLESTPMSGVVRPELQTVLTHLRAGRSVWLRAPWMGGTTTAGRLISEVWRGVVGDVRWVDLNAGPRPNQKEVFSDLTLGGLDGATSSTLFVLDGLPRARRYLSPAWVDMCVRSLVSRHGTCLFVDEPERESETRSTSFPVVDLNPWSADDLGALTQRDDPHDRARLAYWSGGLPGWAMALVGTHATSIDEAAAFLIEDETNHYHRSLIHAASEEARDAARRCLATNGRPTSLGQAFLLRLHGACTRANRVQSELALRILARPPSQPAFDETPMQA